MAEPTGPAARGTTARTAVVRAAWVVLALVPVLWIVELTGPEALNLALRAIWVVLAVGTVAAGVRVFLLPRRPGGRSGSRG